MAASDWIVQSLTSILADFSDGYGDTNSLDIADGYKWRIELMYTDLLAKEILYGLDDREGALGYLSQAYLAISAFVDSLSSTCTPNTIGFPAQIVLRGM